MALVIPIRLASALVGMLLGYYAGVCIEHKWKKESGLGEFIQIVSHIYSQGNSLYPEEYSGEDMEFSSSDDRRLDTSDEETDCSDIE